MTDILTVIEKKIAYAAEQLVDRSDAQALARHLKPALIEMMEDWLELDEVDIASLSGEWLDPATLTLPDIIISRQGLAKARRAAVGLSKPLALAAVGHLLRIDLGADPAALEMLQPFISETVLSLEDPINTLSVMDGLSDGREGWAMMSQEDLIPLLGADDLVQITLEFLIADDETVQLVLLLTPELLKIAEDQQPKPDPVAQPRQAPRLGPCHVDVKAIGDRLRMNIADCSRLEIGQVVALPGLRFDRLDLTVEMGEGPVHLADAALGADNGVKAVRLNRGLDPAFRTPPPDSSAGSTATESPSDFDTLHA